MKKIIFLLIISPSWLTAQNLTFSKPAVLDQDVKSDKAVSLIKFRENFFIAWKEPGTNANIRMSYTAKQFNTNSILTQNNIQDCQSSFAPLLCASDNNLYLFWIDNNSNLRYLTATDTTFSKATAQTLITKEKANFSIGVSACYAGGKIIIASHASSKDQIFIAVANINPDGSLGDAITLPVKNAKTAAYPSVTSFQANKIRITWPGLKDKKVYYCDYDITQNSLQSPVTITGAPAVKEVSSHNMPDSEKVLYIWKTDAKDARLQYKEASGNQQNYEPTYLPDYFATNNPVALCTTGHNNFIMAYTGTDQKLYLSHISDYNPAKWMENAFFPAKENYSLKDIAIPGAHDAGMSVLNATGGKKAGIINECNTLTQVRNIEGQLNAGIRMFDLRIDTYKEELYTKHAPSDCMTDAVAGGYGEKLSDVLKAVKSFLAANNKEIVILGFSHFCSQNVTVQKQAQTIVDALGREIVFVSNGKKLRDITLKELAGKALITFEKYTFPELGIDSNTMTDNSTAFINYKRKYAATNIFDKLLSAEKDFFTSIDVHDNDLVRLDWQVTEASEEAAFICNDFQSEKSNPLVDGAILLINSAKKNKSIIDLSYDASRQLPVKVSAWLEDGTINKKNKPNILYVDVAGTWITDFCVNVNSYSAYQK